MSDASPETDPTPLYRLRDGLFAGDLLAAGVLGLDLFTRIAAQPADRETLCSALDIRARPAGVLLTLCVARGLLSVEDGVYHVTALAREHLVAGSPWDLRPYFASLAGRPAIGEFLAVLRTDQPAPWAAGSGRAPWAAAMQDEAFAQGFTAAMDCRGRFLGHALARTLDLRGRRLLLDIAGGSGVYACAAVGVNPGLAAVVLEKPPVDAAARQAIAARGLDDRVAVLAADMWDDPLPPGADVHLFSHVLHDWDDAGVRQLVLKSSRSLAPGGLLAVHDAHLDADGSGPLAVAEYSALLLHSTRGRCYSVAEMQEIMRTAGLVDVRHLPTVADRSLVVASKPNRP